jgi:iron complex outermembrane receptor protein
MIINRPALLAGLSAAAFATALSSQAFAQAAAPAPGAEQAGEVEAIVVTGTRVQGRTRLETTAPVDVVSAPALTRTGTTELAQALSVALPSLNFTRPAVTDGTDTIRPATLRGLNPDQTLVLVNSKRQHASALVNLNGSVGFGAAAVDLNTLPTAAIGTVEVLRDGASAQYGSDAIAGVVNLRLREARRGGGLSVTVGEYSTQTDWLSPAPAIAGVKLPTSKYFTDGPITTVSGWTGLPLGENGFVTVSAESKVQSHTTRAGPDPRQQYPLVAGAPDPREFTTDRIKAWYGDPQMEQYTGFLNAGYDFNSGSRLYGWVGYQHRDAISAANFRQANQQVTGGNLLSVYPDGYLPKINSIVDDLSAAIGSTFKTGEWNWDASVTYGLNNVDFRTIDSINVSLGPTSPTRFKAGELRYGQWVGNLGVTRQIAIGGLKEVNFAAGGEVRHETYKITAGEPSSYSSGGFTFPGAAAGAGGAQGFPGFAPADATDVDRTSESLYVDFETKPVENLDIDLAGRYEHYSDFGSVVSGKLAARYDFTPGFAIRGAISNGFRAPSLQQGNVSYTAITFVNGSPINNAVLRASNPAAQFIGSVPLKAEKSVNFSGGFVFRAGAFSATVDGYVIRINDRIALSDTLRQANVLALFPASAQIGGARFFTNGLDTTSKGIDAVASYKVDADAAGRFDFTVSASYNDQKLRNVRSTPQLSALNPAPALFQNYRILSLTDGQPKWKGSFVTDWTRGMFGATAKATYYGKLIQPQNGNIVAGDVALDDAVLVDLELRANVWKGLQLAVGANNVFDVYPTQLPYVKGGATLSSNGVGVFPEYSPFGWQGRFLYGRVSYSW